MPHFDRYGLSLSVSSETAAAAYREGVDCVLAAWPGAARAFERAIEADPEFALAHAARARVHAMYAETNLAKAMISAARKLVSLRGTDREKSHVETLALGIEGQSAQSLTNALAHLDNWPRDAMIMFLPLGAFGLFAFSGRIDHNQARVALCEHHARHYGDDWWFLTYLGWSHTENGDVGKGRRITLSAFEKRRQNANVVHALTHAMFEDGSVDEAEALINDWMPIYDRTGIQYGHISWHQSLLALERGDVDRALDIYATRLAPKVTAAAPMNAVTDSISLLWRLHAYGHQVSNEIWNEVVAYAERAFPKAGIAFADVHIGFLAAATGNRVALDQRIAELEKRLADGNQPSGTVVPVICRAARAFADGDYADCVRILEPSAGQVPRIGGSHAQREVVEDTLLVALMRSGEIVKARTLLDERLHRRSSPRDALWRASITP